MSTINAVLAQHSTAVPLVWYLAVQAERAVPRVAFGTIALIKAERRDVPEVLGRLLGR